MRHFDFLAKSRYFIPISVLLVVTSVVMLLPQVRGLNPGIDFTGGTELTVKLGEGADNAAVRDVMAGVSARGIDLSKSVIQDLAGQNTKVITTQLLSAQEDQRIVSEISDALRDAFEVEDISTRLIGQQISRELTSKGWQAILLAMVVILVYVSWRFRLRYAIGALVAVVHDVIIALGVFAVFGIEVNLATIAAFLTIIGYSLNDTIVIYDRIRENLKLAKKRSIYEVINDSVNQSLSRTLNTSFTTFIPVIILFLFGGSVLRPFALALLIGVIVGTYSSMYIANPILYAWTQRSSADKKRK